MVPSLMGAEYRQHQGNDTTSSSHGAEKWAKSANSRSVSREIIPVSPCHIGPLPQALQEIHVCRDYDKSSPRIPLTVLTREAKCQGYNAATWVISRGESRIHFLKTKWGKEVREVKTHLPHETEKEEKKKRAQKKELIFSTQSPRPELHFLIIQDDNQTGYRESRCSPPSFVTHP